MHGPALCRYLCTMFSSWGIFTFLMVQSIQLSVINQSDTSDVSAYILKCLKTIHYAGPSSMKVSVYHPVLLGYFDLLTDIGHSIEHNESF